MGPHLPSSQLPTTISQLPARSKIARAHRYAYLRHHRPRHAATPLPRHRQSLQMHDFSPLPVVRRLLASASIEETNAKLYSLKHEISNYNILWLLLSSCDTLEFNAVTCLQALVDSCWSTCDPAARTKAWTGQVLWTDPRNSLLDWSPDGEVEMEEFYFPMSMILSGIFPCLKSNIVHN